MSRLVYLIPPGAGKVHIASLERDTSPLASSPSGLCGQIVLNATESQLQPRQSHRLCKRCFRLAASQPPASDGGEG